MPVVLITLVIGACNHSDENLIQQNIKKYLSNKLHDTESYESVESKIDTVYMQDYIQDSLTNVADFLLKNILHTKQYSLYRLKIDSVSGIKDRGSIKEYVITHTYRATNAVGAKVINTDIFFLNTKLEVIDTEASRLAKKGNALLNLISYDADEAINSITKSIDSMLLTK